MEIPRRFNAAINCAYKAFLSPKVVGISRFSSGKPGKNILKILLILSNKEK
jgi:TM2 domain-containing membrane protein YozV